MGLERKKKKLKKVEGEIKWRKEGGGSLRWGNRIIKPGEVFSARPEDIPTAFRDVIVALDKLPETDVVKGKETKYNLSFVEKGKWNVVDENEKVINETTMTKAEAQKTIEELEK